MVLAVAHPRASTSSTSYLSSQFLSRESSLFKFFLANSRSDLHATSLAFFPLSSFSLPVSLLLFHPLTHRSPLPRSRSAAPPPPADPLLSLLLSLIGGKRKKTDNPREGWEDDGTPPPPHRDFKERSVVLIGGHREFFTQKHNPGPKTHKLRQSRKG